MAAKGRNLLLQVDIGGTMTTIGALRSKNVSLSCEAVEVTNLDSDDWRELDPNGLGIRSMSVSGSGIFFDDAAAQVVEDAAYSRAAISMKIIFENGDYYTGDFRVPIFERGGSHTAEETVSMSMESSGTIVLTRGDAVAPASNINAVAANTAGLSVIAGDDGKIATSTDGGVTWAIGTSGFGTSNIMDVAHGGTGWLSTGVDGKVFGSSDALTWSAETVGFGTDTVNAAFDDTNGFGVRLIVGASGHLETSPYGGAWTSRTSSFGSNNINDLSNFEYQELLMAAGADGKIAYTGNAGVTWNQATTAFGANAVNSITAIPGYSVSLSVAVGDAGSAEYSTNGGAYVAASTNPFGSNNLNGVETDGTSFIAVGDAGTMGITTDGDIWALIADSSFGSTNINAIFYDSFNSVWIAVGDNGKVATSADGSSGSWTQQTSGF